MSSFQSVKDRHDRMNQPRANGDGLSNTGTSNWRHNTSMGEIKVGCGQYVLTDVGSMSGLEGEEKLVPGAFVGSTSVGSLWPTQSQLESSYAYAIRRVDGQFTQLIRADELRTLDLSKIPATQGPGGLLALPPLLLPRPERYGGGTFTPHKDHESLPKDRADTSGKDSIQRRIDAICATSPVATGSPAPVKTPRRKIYCDKWIHEGVCAFTQLGCKYLHEMPLDKATQLSLGLNHGLPSWYRRAKAVQIRPEQQGSPPTPRVAGPWRRSDGSSSSSTGFPPGNGFSSSPPAGSAYGQQSFGPIGRPPPPTYRQQSMMNNAFGGLPDENTKMEDNGEDETIMWTGRQR